MHTDISAGTIQAFHLDGEGGGSGITREELERWTPAGGPIWVHIFGEAPSSGSGQSSNPEDWLRTGSGLSEAVCDGLLATETRPRCTVFDEGLLVTLRGVNLNPGADPEDMVAIRLWLDRGRLITVCRRSLMAVGDMKTSIEQGSGPTSVAELMTGVASNLLKRMVPTLEDLSDAVDLLEERAVCDSSKEIQTDLAEYRRQVISLRRHLAPQREAMGQLAHTTSKVLGDSDRHSMKLLADHVTRFVEELDELRELTAVTHDLLLSRQSDQMNQRMLTLSIVTTIFLPLGLVTGLLGINVGGIPGSTHEWAFAGVCGILLALTGLQLLIMRHKKWF
jgi:zinc transporter